MAISLNYIDRYWLLMAILLNWLKPPLNVSGDFTEVPQNRHWMLMTIFSELTKPEC